MKLEFYRTLWGLEQELEPYLTNLKSRGYHGIETSLLFHQTAELELFKDVKKFDLKLILLILTFGKEPLEHLKSLEEQLIESLKFDPVKINVHGGCDYWNSEQITEYFKGVELLKLKYPNVEILHETHRSRILFTPWNTNQVLKQFPSIKITADLSHWVVVCERHLDEFDLSLVYKNVGHIHARPCTPQSIQLHSPNDPSFKEDLGQFKKYWKDILRMKKAQGVEIVTVDPEFGPAPYSTLFNGQAIGNLDEASDFILGVFNELLVSVNLE